MDEIVPDHGSICAFAIAHLMRRFQSHLIFGLHGRFFPGSYDLRGSRSSARPAVAMSRLAINSLARRVARQNERAGCEVHRSASAAVSRQGPILAKRD